MHVTVGGDRSEEKGRGGGSGGGGFAGSGAFAGMVEALVVVGSPECKK